MISDMADLGRFLGDNETLVVVSGAGVSTASGIPAYRDALGRWRHSVPVQFAEFRNSAVARQRYWSRSFAGWPRFACARPNAAHHALAALESAGRIDTLVSQNVDGLHAQAGSRRVIDLHGDLGRVVCLSCLAATDRRAFQSRLEAANPGWRPDIAGYGADGDAELGADGHSRFRVPACADCNGVLKPDVVMFGEAVPRARVEAAMSAVERADALLVVGSSLTVYSGFRFVKHAHALGKPIAIINRGRTRGDPLATLKIDQDCSAALPSIARPG